jgi:hypothetical protein
MDFFNGLNQLNGKWGQKAALNKGNNLGNGLQKLEGKVGGASLNGR